MDFNILCIIQSTFHSWHVLLVGTEKQVHEGNIGDGGGGEEDRVGGRDSERLHFHHL